MTMGLEWQKHDEKARVEAATIAGVILTNPRAMTVEWVSDLAVLGFLMRAHGRLVRDFTIRSFEKMEDEGGIEKMMSGINREIGLHSNIPECCVEYFAASIDELAKNHPRLSGRAVSDLAGGVRYFETRRLLGVPREQMPKYITCIECTEGILAGTIVPNKLHYCEDESESPLCAKWIEARERRRAANLSRNAKALWRGK